MNSLLWILIGGTLGLAYSTATASGSGLDIVANIVAGVVGAVLAGRLLAAPFGPTALDAREVSFPSLLVAPLGALVLLVLEHLVRLSRVA